MQGVGRQGRPLVESAEITQDWCTDFMALCMGGGVCSSTFVFSSSPLIARVFMCVRGGGGGFSAQSADLHMLWKVKRAGQRLRDWGMLGVSAEGYVCWQQGQIWFSLCQFRDSVLFASNRSALKPDWSLRCGKPLISLGRAAPEYLSCIFTSTTTTALP